MIRKTFGQRIFELMVYAIVIGAIFFGLYRGGLFDAYLESESDESIFEIYINNENVDSQENQNNENLQTQRRNQFCTDNSPEHSTVILDTFTQININGQWRPQVQECEWTCIDGYVKVGSSCVDANECNIENPCSEDTVCNNIEGGYICVDEPQVSAEDKIYNDIYLTYPASNNGKEIIYPFLDEGNIEVAHDMINDVYLVSNRYEPVILNNIKWDEDPYSENYWRFIFYSLRPTKDLLYAWETTGDDRYREKLEEIVIGFIDDGGMQSNYSWDKHGAAFRTMVLVNTWWKLREGNELDQEESIKMLKALEEHGKFLEKNENYENDSNHGITEAAALYLLGVNFPHLERAEKWKELGQSRLDETTKNLVDDNGVFVENSPYYHFYTLKFYWNIHHYSKEHKIKVSDNFDETVSEMISYGAYILQPDLRIPTLGSSLDGSVLPRREYEEMAEENPQFMYVLTQGERGIKPSQNSIFFEDAGQSIFRSGWGDENDFSEQTQIIFDVGNYRTTHSQLDALSFHLYANKKVIFPDSGLYTYEDGKEKDYFFGTDSHNTITADDADQKRRGTINTGLFVQEDKYTYHSAEHFLYENITHQRAIILYEKDLVIIIDNIYDQDVEAEHKYSQLFHLFPEAEIKNDGLDVTIFDENGDRIGKIVQLKKENIDLETTIGDNEPYRGWCSLEYEVASPCYYISFDSLSNQQQFITILDLSRKDKYSGEIVENSTDDFLIEIFSDDKKIRFNIEDFLKNSEKVSVEEEVSK